MSRYARDLCCMAPLEQIMVPEEDKEKIVDNRYGLYPKNDGAIFIHGSSGGSAGCAVWDGTVCKEGSCAVIQMKAYKNQIPVIALVACRKAGEYQAGGIILVLGLYFSKAPVFRFFKTEMSGERTSPRMNELQIFCPIMQAQGVLIKPVWMRWGSMRIYIRHISGRTVSRPLKQNPANSCIRYDCEGSDICEG